jgi:hypothetical protein
LHGLVDPGDTSARGVDVPRADLDLRPALALLEGPRLLRRLRLRRDRALDVNGVEGQATCDGSHPVDALDLVERARRERELRGGDEVVARKLVARLAEVSEPEASSPVLLHELSSLLLRELWEASALGRREVDWPRDRHVGSHARQRFEYLCLCAVEPGRERRHGHDEADSEPQSEGRQHGAATAPAELREHVGEKEHAPDRTASA